MHSRVHHGKSNSTLLAEPLVPCKHCTKEPWITRKTSRLGLLQHYPLLSMPHQVPQHSPTSGTGSLCLRIAVLSCHEAAVAQLLTSCSAQTSSGMSMTMTSHSSAAFTCEALGYKMEVCWHCVLRFWTEKGYGAAWCLYFCLELGFRPTHESRGKPCLDMWWQLEGTERMDNKSRSRAQYAKHCKPHTNIKPYSELWTV